MVENGTKYRRLVHGLRDCDIGGPMTVYNIKQFGASMRFEVTTIQNPLTYEQFIIGKNQIQREKLAKKRKK
jgi:hypothetical protein